ncbi:GTP cyclohydrolase FolE2 [Suttonella sp. R2A3]|uniref:GTP cyclohydrolase FolE2 n=1 Tax=Suttonella sp. R2A3 TaxID=2908648 RepID=UPI001F2C8978|nr:GTP cyclohydrolase FolE2 [Suttonella sp. R2A3]UJF24657.1 GTP cyclohydrolase FolE2 [Suttonella sp. R2A3]
MTQHHSIPDVQGSPDARHIAINRVGVREIRVPLAVRSAQGEQHTIASAELTVALPHEQKGTHMSRFIHLLNHRQALSSEDLASLHIDMLELLDAEEATIELRFPFFVRKTAPVSKVESLLEYEVCWVVDGSREASETSIEVTVPVTSLCPCSKEISKYGAHNQRSHVIITALLDPDQPISEEELIVIGEESGSCPLWSTLKRPDEKYVTERAYENPKFVEDIVRDAAAMLNQDARVKAYRVSSENFESIHNHSAYAVIEHDKRDA